MKAVCFSRFGGPEVLEIVPVESALIARPLVKSTRSLASFHAVARATWSC